MNGEQASVISQSRRHNINLNKYLIFKKNNIHFLQIYAEQLQNVFQVLYCDILFKLNPECTDICFTPFDVQSDQYNILIGEKLLLFYCCLYSAHAQKKKKYNLKSSPVSPHLRSAPNRVGLKCCCSDYWPSSLFSSPTRGCSTRSARMHSAGTSAPWRRGQTESCPG